MADTSFSDTTATTPGTSIVSAWLNVVNKFVYWGRNPNYAVTTGTANAQILTIVDSLQTAISGGDTYTFKASLSNTLTATLTLICGSTTVVNTATVKTQDLTNLSAGAILQDSIYTVIYEATGGYWILLGTTQPAILLE